MDSEGGEDVVKDSDKDMVKKDEEDEDKVKKDDEDKVKEDDEDKVKKDNEDKMKEDDEDKVKKDDEDKVKEDDEDKMKEDYEDVVKEDDEDEVKEDDEDEVTEDEVTEDEEDEVKEDEEDEVEEDEVKEGDENLKEGDEDVMKKGEEDVKEDDGDVKEGEEDVAKEGDEEMKEIEKEALELLKRQAEVITEDVIKGATDSFREQKMKEEAAKAKYKVKNIKWMKCEDFTVARGVLQIEEYMKVWELHESWLHWTSYLGEEELKYSIQFHYRVRWSIPTCRKPIPRATASVYFVIEISKVKPRSFPVEVFFMVETNKLIHRPGESRFKEKWLKDVIESKICMMETVDF